MSDNKKGTVALEAINVQATQHRPTEASSVANIVTRLTKPALLELVPATDAAGAIKVLVGPGGDVFSIKKFIDEYRTGPERQRGTVTLHDLSSFVQLVIRFRDEGSAIFADRSNPAAPSLTAVFDYSRGNGAAPRFGEHRAVYPFPLSDEWKAWTSADKKPMSQAAFAEFLEGRIADVVDPLSALETTREIMESLLCKFASPARLVDLARSLTVRVESVVANQQNLSNGESMIRYDTVHTDERGAPLDVPGAFLTSIPVFRSDVRYQLAARLRYRVKEGKVTWWFDLYRAAETFDHAFSQACLVASANTILPLFFGAAEAVK